jgi:hypothetical protein
VHKAILALSLDHLILDLDTANVKSSIKNRQSLAENPVFKLNPLHAIGKLFCPIAGEGQAHSEDFQDGRTFFPLPNCDCQTLKKPNGKVPKHKSMHDAES